MSDTETLYLSAIAVRLSPDLTVYDADFFVFDSILLFLETLTPLSCNTCPSYITSDSRSFQSLISATVTLYLSAISVRLSPGLTVYEAVFLLLVDTGTSE